MHSILRKIHREDIAAFGIAVMIACLVLSRYVLSIGMIILVVNALLSPSLKSDFRNFLANKPLVAITSLFLLCLLSGIYSDDYGYLLERWRIKLPFLLLPFAFSVLRPFSEKRFYLLLSFFLLVITVSATAVTVNYFLHFRQVTESYRAAQVMPTPIGHIHFSLMTAFAIVTGIYLFAKKWHYRFKAERILILACTLFLLVFIHMLSVRSGLLALYAGFVGIAWWYVFTNKRYLLGLLLLGIIVSLPYAAYRLMPTFKNKMDYMRYDWKMYRQGAEPSQYSDGGRFYSYKAGWEIAKKNLWLGTGYGDLKKEAENFYMDNYPEIDASRRLFPHNQFLFFLSAMGIAGLTWLLFVFFFPLLYKRNHQHVLLLCFHLIMLTAFMVESYIEDQIGTAFYLLFLLLLLNQIQGGKPKMPEEIQSLP